jgi:hypothetical protein
MLLRNQLKQLRLERILIATLFEPLLSKCVVLLVIPSHRRPTSLPRLSLAQATTGAAQLRFRALSLAQATTGAARKHLQRRRV